MSKSIKSKYRPQYPSKYNGNPNDIVCRSSWERTFCKWCDLTENIIQWSSEEMFIPYRDPVTKKVRRYFPDFIIRIQDSDGLIRTEMIEVKPYKEVIGPPKNPKRRTKSWLYAVTTFVTNSAKWDAARDYCSDRGWQFRIVTEYDLGLKKKR